MNKFKVMTVVGTRPEIIKLSEVIKKIDSYLDHIIVHTGQNFDYELNEIFFEQLGVRKPNHFLNAAKETASGTIGAIISEMEPILLKENPDAILLYGDTNSCLSVIPAKKHKIPIFHMEAGNRCFDQRVPEEINRKIVDHLSDINLPLSEHARRYLIDEGISPETIIKIGSPMREVLDTHMENINSSNILKTEKLKKDEFFIVSIHREENVDNKQNFNDLLDSLNIIANTYNYPVIVSTHPRTRNKLESLKSWKKNPLIRFLKPFGFHDYNNLQMNAKCVISDSGTIAEESCILKFPAITIRQAHERPEANDVSSFIMSGLQSDDVIRSIDVVVKEHHQHPPAEIDDYKPNDVSSKVLKIMLSYTHYVNRTVWKKN
ncbi:UDP-N-acetylglucosamine 2-epimerase (non-hydrolyzing) [Gammaproteobacteria bacterium]|nr:UDP-N-acetylglucosamine 2-epimerase (non-hydrolyzing) [Gammaproteobacteria bacterium]MDB2677772.1 UDP-N-acetylglucosamine 2-epimerase (non-hydrolyzing) [Gammaproteobacteria bacterium]